MKSSKNIRLRVHGKYATNRQWLRSKNLILMGFISGIAVSLPNFYYGSPKSAVINPQDGVVQVVGVAKAADLEAQPTPTPSPAVKPQTVEEKIRARDWANDDVAVFYAKCESGLNPLAHGDKTLMVYDPVNKEMVGDSKGLYQIRTGGKERKTGRIWNRARANGMTAEEFRTWLENPDNNIDYAFKMSKGGKKWASDWVICTRKLGR